MDVESTTEQQPQSQVDAEYLDVPAKVTLGVPKFVAQQEINPNSLMEESSHDLTDNDLIYMALGIVTGEMPVGVIRMSYTLERMDNGTKSDTDSQFVRSTARSVLLKEGQGLWHYLRLWSTISMVTLFLAYLSWVIIAITRSADSGWQSAFGTANAGLILTSLVGACSLASLVQRLGSSGWRRSRRLLWAWLSPSQYKKRWRETDHMFGVYGTRNKAPSSVKWLGVFVTCIAWTGVSSMLPFLLG